MTFKPVKYTDAKTFVADTKQEFKDALGNKKGFAYISAGIDSTTCGKLAVESVGEANFLGILFEHGGMREGECKNALPTLNRDCGILTIFRDYSEIFLERVIAAGPDSEDKRIYGISAAYFDLALEEAKKLGRVYWVQGTLEPDVIETTGSKLKTQHNVLLEKQKKRFKEAGVQVVEPLILLRKNHVREVARYLGLPAFVTERQPFPGPGLYCRAVGQVTRDKMNKLREADAVVMEDLERYTKDVAPEDFQCFVALIDNKTSEFDIDGNYGISIKGKPKVTEDKVTGMVENQRAYNNLLLIDAPDDETPALIDASERIVKENLDRGIGRVAVLLSSRIDRDAEYIAVLRSILTEDFTKAEVAPIKHEDLDIISRRLLRLVPDGIDQVYYDITPKPPATIEFE
ncbi:MAG: hypothetical protein GTN36_06015 [Candidatus Aenigmarchaeota archaeon]|nr:hypothetical protein [Candidatus Aenigmarchaeota archaeon]